MGSVFFYHLTQSGVETTLATLAERALAQGWRVAVRARDPARLNWLDQHLWLGPDDGFLPHGLAGGPHDALQPVLLTTGAAEGRACLIALDSAEVAPAEVEAAERVCILFDGKDETAVEAARDQWRQLTEAGLAAQYWSEETGRWQKKAEKAGRE